MLYYYGNDYTEAIDNNPVEIETTDDLRQYQECYNVVIPIDEVYEYQEEYDTKAEVIDLIEGYSLKDYYIKKGYEVYIIYYNLED